MDTRTPGLRGRIPGQLVAVPHLNNYRTTAHTFSVSYPVDVTAGIVDWKMLGNGPDGTLTANGGNPVGDCTFAGREHYRMAKAAAGKLAETWETSDELVTEYLDYNNGQDVGANISQLLLNWYQDGKILGFAKLDPSDKQEVDWGVQTFHGVYCGVSLTADADELFAQHLPWTTANGERPNLMEGHCIVKVGGTPSQDTYVTWGALQNATVGWTSACLEEAYVVITEEDAKAASLDIDQLRQDLNLLLDAHGATVPATGCLKKIASWFSKVIG